MMIHKQNNRALLYWVNSIVTIPEALLIDSLDELVDGKLLCELIYAILPKSMIANVSLEEFDDLLDAAVRMMYQIDRDLRLKVQPVIRSKRIISEIFGGDRIAIVIAILRALRKFSKQQIQRNQALPIEKEKTTLVSNTACINKKPHSSNVIPSRIPKPKQRRDTSSSPPPPPPPPQTNAGWNASTLLEKPPPAIDQSRNQNKHSRKPNQSSTDTKLQDSLHRSSKVTTESAPPKSTLKPNQKEVLRWILDNTVLLSSVKRLARFTDARSLTMEELLDLLPYDNTEVVPALFRNGVMLCEFVRCLEHEYGNQRLDSVEFNVVSRSGQKKKLLVLRGCTMDPKTHAARVRNISLAFDILKSRADMNTRFLFDPWEFEHHCDTIIWELLHDIRSSYAPYIAASIRRTEASQSRLSPTKPLREAHRDTSPVKSILVSRGKVQASPKKPIYKDPPKQRPTVSKPKQSSISNSKTRLLSSKHVTMKPPSNIAPQASSPPLRASKPPPPPTTLSFTEVERRYLDRVVDEISNRDTSKSLSTRVPDEVAIESWLHVHGLNIDARKRNEPLLKDITRNGVFYVDLFSTLNSRIASMMRDQCVIHRTPNTLAEASENFRNAFRATSKLFVAMHHEKGSIIRDCEKQLLAFLDQESIIQRLMKGREPEFWKLLEMTRTAFDTSCLSNLLDSQVKSDVPAEPSARKVRLQDAYQTAAPKEYWTASKGDNSRNPKQAFTLQYDLPYTAKQIEDLDQSLIVWLTSLRVLDAYCVGQPDSLFDNGRLLQEFSNGTILLDITRKLCNGALILGFQKRPDSVSAAMKNIQLIVNVLMGVPNMGRRFLTRSCIKRIAYKDANVIRGLLEDMHRAFDNQLPRPVIAWGAAAQPYLGLDSAQFSDNLERKECRSDSDTESDDNEIDIIPHSEMYLSYTDRPRVDLIPMRNSEPMELRHLSTSEAKRHNRNDDNDEDIAPSHNNRMSLDSSRLSRISGTSCQTCDSCRSLGINPASAEENMFKRYKTVVSWLKHKHGIILKNPEVFEDREGKIPEFGSGVKLCRIVEKLEHIRFGIRGIDPDPKMPAACIHNISCALKILRKKSNMSPDYLFCENEIYAGKVSHILPLLFDIMKAYKRN